MLKPILTAAATSAAVLISLASPAAAADDGTVTFDEFTQVHVGDTKWQVEQTFGTTGDTVDSLTVVDDTGTTIVKGYHAEADHRVLIGFRYHKNPDQTHFHVVVGAWCQDSGSVIIS